MFHSTRLSVVASRVASCVLSCVAASALAAGEPAPRSGAPDANPETPATRPAGEAAGLRLLSAAGAPAAAPDASTLKALTGSRWAEQSARDILGRGVDTILDFHQDEGQKLTLETTTRAYRSVNEAGDKFRETKTSAPATVEGPLLRDGGEQQTFVLVPGKELVLNALVPTGGGKWYYTARQTWGKGEHRDEEMLLEFADDPMKKDEGGGTIQLTSSNGPRILKEAVRFTLLRADKQGRLVAVVSADAQNHARLAEILFPPGGTYGLVLDRPNLNSKLYTAEPAKK